MSWIDLLKAGFTLWAKVDEGQWMELARESGSRDDTFELVKNEAKKLERTVVGSASEGKIVVIDDGIFENITEQIIYYVIKPSGEPSPDRKHIPNTSESTTSSGTVRRLSGDFETGERY